MGLKYTNIPKLVGIELDYIGFSYRGPLNRVAPSGEVDGLLPAILEVKALAPMPHCGRLASPVVARPDMVERRRPGFEAFLRAFQLSWFCFANNPERSSAWLAKE